jgi:hypothetical protein
VVGACAGRTDSRVEAITPARPVALAGAPTVIAVSVTSECWNSCRETAHPVLELDTGAPLPPSLRYEVVPDSTKPFYFIGNPGTGSPFATGPATCPGWTYLAWTSAGDMFATCTFKQAFRGFSIRLVADPATGPTSFGLRLRIPDCGEELVAPFTLELVGAAQDPGMCALSTGAPCIADADCSADGCFNENSVCGSTRPPSSCLGSLLAGPPGAACGCVAGICSWH